MKIVILHYGEISDYPPTRSLIKNMASMGHMVTVIARDRTKSVVGPNVKVIKMTSYGTNTIDKIVTFFKNKQLVRNIINDVMAENDLVWITSPEAIRYIGDDIFKYKYILQLMELTENVSKYPMLKKPRLNMKLYAQKAYKVVVPEINRAYIQKVWWGLSKVPVVLPNKPYDLPTIDQETDEIHQIILEMDKEHRKKILYQGVFSEDRNLNAVAEAIGKIQDKVCLYIMGKDDDNKKVLCKKYPFIKYIPFQIPPKHLLITQHADIGLLPYVASNTDVNSPLNALYCAPNKIYEYTAYGIPMIGSDVLGLLLPFEKYGIGTICREFTQENIVQSISTIINNYEKMSRRCIEFYNNVDLKKIVEECLSD